MEASKGKLLIVDDELSVRDSLGKWFREEGYDMGTAETAQDALARMAECLRPSKTFHLYRESIFLETYIFGF